MVSLLNIAQTNKTICGFEEIDDILESDIDFTRKIEQYEPVSIMHKRLSNLLYNKSEIITALEESYNVIDNDYVVASMEEKLGVIKKLYLKSVTYVQNLINMFKKWFYKFRDAFVESDLYKRDFLFIMEYPGQPIELKKADLDELNKKFPALDVSRTKLDLDILKGLEHLHIEQEFKKGDNKISDLDFIDKDVIDKAKTELEKNRKDGKYGNKFTSKAKIDLVFSTLKYGRFSITEKINDKVYSKFVKIDYKPIGTAVTIFHEANLVKLFDKVEEDDKKGVYKKIYNIAYDRNNHILKEMRKLIDKDDFTDDDKIELAVLKENVKNGYIIVRDYLQLTKDIREYIKEKDKLYDESKSNSRSNKKQSDSEVIDTEIIDDKDDNKSSNEQSNDSKTKDENSDKTDKKVTREDVIKYIKKNPFIYQDVVIIMYVKNGVNKNCIINYIKNMELINYNKDEKAQELVKLISSIDDDSKRGFYKDLGDLVIEIDTFEKIFKGKLIVKDLDEKIKNTITNNAIEDEIVSRIFVNLLEKNKLVKDMDDQTVMKINNLTKLYKKPEVLKYFKKLDSDHQRAIISYFDSNNVAAITRAFKQEFLVKRCLSPQDKDIESDTKKQFDKYFIKPKKGFMETIFGKKKDKDKEDEKKNNKPLDNTESVGVDNVIDQDSLVGGVGKLKNDDELYNKYFVTSDDHPNHKLEYELNKVKNPPVGQTVSCIKHLINRKISKFIIFKILNATEKEASGSFAITDEYKRVLSDPSIPYTEDKNAFIYDKRKNSVEKFVRTYVDLVKTNEITKHDLTSVITGAYDSDISEYLKKKNYSPHGFFTKDNDLIKVFIANSYEKNKTLKGFIADLKNIKYSEDLTSYDVLI